MPLSHSTLFNLWKTPPGSHVTRVWPMERLKLWEATSCFWSKAGLISLWSLDTITQNHRAVWPPRCCAQMGRKQTIIDCEGFPSGSALKGASTIPFLPSSCAQAPGPNEYMSQPSWGTRCHWDRQRGLLWTPGNRDSTGPPGSSGTGRGPVTLFHFTLSQWAPPLPGCSPCTDEKQRW